MGLNQTPSGERIHIGFFGKRNAGKSSVLNAVTGQDLAVVSDVRGTTTDPVYKSMELLPLGPVMMIDTAGIDDEGALGQQRVEKSLAVLNKTDIAVLVVDGTEGFSEADIKMLDRIAEKGIPSLVVWNKADLLSAEELSGKGDLLGDRGRKLLEEERLLFVSAAEKTGIEALKERIARLYKPESDEKKLVQDLISPLDLVVLVVPIDKAAPKGRLMLPQQQTIRDILESGAGALVVRDTELAETLSGLWKKPALVITDSQVFGVVSRIVPEDIPLTSFSILFARYKGNLAEAVKGAAALRDIQDGDRILISEGCTHHRQCNDIGTVKLPGWIREYTGKEPEFCFTSGTEFPQDLSSYKMVVHCGGCMLNEREMQHRLKVAAEQGVPMTNYGILIAMMKGILPRSVQMFPKVAEILV